MISGSCKGFQGRFARFSGGITEGFMSIQGRSRWLQKRFWKCSISSVTGNFGVFQGFQRRSKGLRRVVEALDVVSNVFWGSAVGCSSIPGGCRGLLGCLTECQGRLRCLETPLKLFQKLP